MIKFALTLGLLCSLLCSPAHGGLIFDNGMPDDAGCCLILVNITAHRHADDFDLAGAASLAAIRFWAGASIGFLADFDGAITWAVYNDAGGSPGTLVDSQSVSGIVPYLAAFQISGIEFFVIDFNLAAPLPLAAGSYWLELHEGPSLTADDGSSLYWASSDPVAGNAKFGSIHSVPHDDAGLELAFQLFDTPFSQGAQVPEPNTALLITCGLVALVFRVQRRFRFGSRMDFMSLVRKDSATEILDPLSGPHVLRDSPTLKPLSPSS